LPFGRRNSSGTIFFTCVCLSSVGGVGLALYSVRAKLLSDGVLARGPSLCEGVCVVVCAVLLELVTVETPSTPLGPQGLASSEEAMFPGERLLTVSIVGVS
jgi:hypothetical protein